MKKNILFKIAASLFSIMAVLSSCNTDAEGVIYNPDATANTSFASSQMNVELTTDYAGKVEVPIYRGSTEGEATVTLSLSMNDEAAEIFSLQSQTIKFEDGQAVANAVIKFTSLDDLGVTTKYTLTLTLPEESVSPSAEASLKVVLGRKLTWESLGEGTYVSEFFEQDWPQPIEKAKEGNIYRLIDCIYEGYPFIFTLSDDGQSLLSWDSQPTGYVASGYMLYYKAVGMEREGKTLKFSIIGQFLIGGSFVTVTDIFTETVILP